MIKNILIGSLVIVVGVVVWMNARSTVATMPNTLTNTATTVVQHRVPTPMKTDGVILDVSNKGLTTLPQTVFKQGDVTSLNVSNNKLSGSLPAEVRLLSKLTVLNLAHNNFTGVPAEIGQLKELRVLDLSNNPITGLPIELGNLSKLEKLDLSGTRYSKTDLQTIREKLPRTAVIVTE